MHTEPSRILQVDIHMKNFSNKVKPHAVDLYGERQSWMGNRNSDC